MFEELFTTSKVIERYQAAPFAEERRSYLRHRAELGTRRGHCRPLRSISFGCFALWI